ncbi:MFS family permease [Bradyrhizobium sp. i1.3.1]
MLPPAELSGPSSIKIEEQVIASEAGTDMTDQPKLQTFSVTAPLRYAVFRHVWLASLLSNLGILIRGVGAAWAMTEMTSSADKVALVQTATSLPVMLIALPAGAIADMYDRRLVALIALSIALGGVTALTVLQWLGLTTPNLLLVLCFVVGTGVALMYPAWQSSVAEQVPAESLAAAVTLNGISFNIARSFGPAIGGIVVGTAGAVAAFGINAVLYLPLMIALLFLETGRRAVAVATRAVESRHYLGRALYQEFSAHQDRADPRRSNRSDRQFGLRAHAAARARSLRRWRTDLRYHARRLWLWCRYRGNQYW